MNPRARNMLVVAVLVLIGLVLWLRPAPPVEPYDKTIEVNVVNVSIQVPEAVASVPAGRPGMVKWVFGNATSGYLFPAAASSPGPGIAFKDATGTPPPGCTRMQPAASSPFHNCNAKQQGAEFHCNARRADPGDCYAYSVTVVPASAGASAPPTLDPMIRNE